MQIQVNGEGYTVSKHPLTIEALLLEKKVDMPEMVSVQSRYSTFTSGFHNFL